MLSCDLCNRSGAAKAALVFSDVSFRHCRMMLQTVLGVANWDQLERIWEFIVGFFKFLWALLRFLGGG
ncbi:hypothetical protein GCM10010985_02770 [Caballeronia grimmiae]|uniref:Uncharacterized protein n=1 Tax=Caballeronia grimmiae TaxID=1071679 RepID=A0ABQ1R137_9BURK|nr:hypothetical protein GCM10010985_02770 [Caballeronia grimmiae]